MSKKTSQSAAQAAKRLARLAAVQALYQSSFEQQTPAQIMSDSLEGDFASLREDDGEGPAITATPDKELFGKIVEGVAAHKEELDAMVAGALDARLSADRLERLLQTILRAGAFELYRHDAIATGVIISDYVDVAHAFFNGKEPGLVNGILDKLAGKLRQH